MTLETLPTAAQVLDSYKDFVENNPLLVHRINGHLDPGGSYDTLSKAILESSEIEKLLKELFGQKGTAALGYAMETIDKLTKTLGKEAMDGKIDEGALSKALTSVIPMMTAIPNVAEAIALKCAGKPMKDCDINVAELKPIMDKELPSMMRANLWPKDQWFMQAANNKLTEEEMDSAPTKLEMKKALMTLKRFVPDKAIKQSQDAYDEIDLMFGGDSHNNLSDLLYVQLTANGDAYFDYLSNFAKKIEEHIKELKG